MTDPNGPSPSSTAAERDPVPVPEGPPSATAPERAPRRRGRANSEGAPVGHTRIGGAWAAVAVIVVFGVALIDFIVENTRSVRVDFFSASGHLPVGVALLAAALAGAAVVLTVGVCRTAQLRLAIRRRARVSESATLAVVVSDAHRADGIVP